MKIAMKMNLFKFFVILFKNNHFHNSSFYLLKWGFGVLGVERDGIIPRRGSQMAGNCGVGGPEL